MNNEKVKIINKKTGVIKEVKKSLAGDYVGTGDFELLEESEKEPSTSFANSFKDIKKNK